MLFKKKNILLKLLFYYKVLNKIISYVLFPPFSLHALYLLSFHDFKKLFEMYYIDNKLSRSWIIKIYFLFIFIIFSLSSVVFRFVMISCESANPPIFLFSYTQK